MKLLSSFAESARMEALSRFELLRPHLKAGLPLRVAAGEAGVAFRTAQRWVARYLGHGLAGLAREPRGDKGRPRGISLEIRWLIGGLCQEAPGLPARSVHARRRRWRARWASLSRALPEQG